MEKKRFLNRVESQMGDLRVLMRNTIRIKAQVLGTSLIETMTSVSQILKTK